MSDEREPDTADDPRRQGTGEGYPESEPQEQTPVEGTEQGPEAGEDPGQSSVPSGADQDDAPSGATGNPGAAGG
jgi:hypothetical protein